MIESILSSIEHIQFTKDGKWLITVDVRPIPGKHSEDNHTIIKFWQFSEIAQKFELSTEVVPPHKSVTSLSVCPVHNFVVTTGSEGKFAIWENYQVESSDDKQFSNFSWRCRSIGYYRNKSASGSAFSCDGSLLAISYGTTITIWDPLSIMLKKTLKFSFSSFSLKFLHFLTDSPFLIAASPSHLYVWNLLTLKIFWFTEMVEIHSVAVDPISPRFSVMVNRKFSDNSFRCVGDDHPFTLDKKYEKKLHLKKANRVLPKFNAKIVVRQSPKPDPKNNHKKRKTVPMGNFHFIFLL